MSNKSVKPPKIDSFDFSEGRVIAKKYEIISKLGGGWEGEVYKVRERNTGIERAAKLFFPQRNLRNKTSKLYARKLHKLNHCPIAIHYLAEEEITFRRTPIAVLISEFVEGEILTDFLKRQPGKRLTPFQGLHLLHTLALGLESIHNEKEYHGDLHSENIIVSRYGLRFEIKLLDFFHCNHSKRENIQDDICSAIQIFHESLGGAKHYAKQRPEVKQICCGLKHSLILKRFPRISLLINYLETMQWE